jgi:uncharacterized membrane protein YccC
MWRRADIRAGLRIGLALVLAYAIALAMDWEKPLWAGISVVVLAVAPVEAALEKAWLRVLGSLAGAFMAFCFVAWFPQERWWFLISLSLWVGLCGFFMRRSPHPYAWNVAGFVAAIIAIGAGPPDGAQFFSTAMERLQETGCGILSFTLCALLIGEPSDPEPGVERWDDCREALLALASHVEQTFHGNGLGSEQQDQLKRTALAAISKLGAVALPISAGPAELRNLVEALHHLWLNLIRAPQVVRQSLQLPWQQVLTSMRTTLGEPGDASNGLESHNGSGTETETGSGTSVQVEKLDLQDRSLLRLSNELLAVLEQQVQALSGSSGSQDLPMKRRILGTDHVLEDDVIAAAQVSITMLCGSLLWIFLPDLPTGPTLLTLLAPIAMSFCNSFGSPAYKILVYVAQAILIGAVLQVFVLTRLTDYTSLAIVLFGLGMGVTVWKYNNGLARIFLPVVVISILSITNVQNFSFLAILNTALMWLLIAAIVTVVGEFPFSSHPDALFYRLYTRFTRLTSRLTGAHPMAWGYPSALGAPSELQVLLGAIKPERLPASSQQLTALVRSCDACRFWLGTWWSCKEQCKEITALHGNMPALSSQLERKSPEKQLSMAQAHVRQTITTCEQYFSASSPNLSPPGASAVERYLGLSWQLLWSLDDLASHSTSVDWLHWPKPPLPWSEA